MANCITIKEGSKDRTIVFMQSIRFSLLQPFLFSPVLINRFYRLMSHFKVYDLAHLRMLMITMALRLVLRAPGPI